MTKEENNQKKVKKAKKSGGNKFLAALAYVPKRMWHAILHSIAELKKVTWPSRKDLINYTVIVLIFMVLMAIVVGLLDLGASELIAVIIRR
ncbi:MAG: preprotein translocase subunit SecE [Firmicutes bacterium]|nr:preprotein translocase subunit SecE [Bacillota bacterium]